MYLKSHWMSFRSFFLITSSNFKSFFPKAWEKKHSREEWRRKFHSEIHLFCKLEKHVRTTTVTHKNANAKWYHREKDRAVVTSVGWDAGSDGGRENEAGRRGDVFFNYNQLRPQPESGWLENSSTFPPGNRLSVHIHSHTLNTERHTSRHNTIPLPLFFFNNQFHFTWSLDMAMISILSFWIVIGLSSSQMLSEEGRRRLRRAGGSRRQ